MDQDSIIQYITGTFDGIDVVVASGDAFFFYNPGGERSFDHKLPFATLVTDDTYDDFSDLNRPSVFRLNIGVSKDTHHSLFGPRPLRPDADGVVDAGHDFTALDQLLPHPVYAPQFWVCVLNPSSATFQVAVRPLLAEAYDQSVRRHARVRTVERP